jgi:hypothetical protein
MAGERLITLDEQIACVKREVALRKNVYPKQVAGGHMTRPEAERQLLHMEAVLETLQWVKETTREHQD